VNGDLALRREQAISAISDFICDSLVFLAPGFGKVVDMWVGSAVAIASNSGVALLTAAHNVNDLAGKPLRLGGKRIEQTIDDAIHSIIPHPSDDVAIAHLKPPAATALKPWALDVSSIGTDQDLDSEADALWLTGFPAAFKHVAPTGPSGAVALGFTSVCYGTHLRTPPHDNQGRLCVAWTQRELGGGGTEKMPDPGGISGGGLWRAITVPKHAVWHSAAAAQLIGIQSAWDGLGTAFVVPVSRWREWLMGQLSVASVS
jgi:hypothetical protein